jgi:cytochrome c553
MKESLGRIAVVGTLFVVAACGRAASGAGAGEAAKPAVPSMPAGVTAAMIAQGDSIYHAHACARCHGAKGAGGQNGPLLAKGDTAKWLHSSGKYEEIVATITRGVPRDSLRDKTRRFAMNPRGSNPPINDDAVKAVAAYIWKLNHP